MEGQSSVRKQAKFKRRILCRKRRILRSRMLNEHPENTSTENFAICYIEDITWLHGDKNYLQVLKVSLTSEHRE